MKSEIKREIDLDAPIERVWVALTDHVEFGTWFRLSLQGPFRLGEVTFGEVTFPGHEGLPFWARVEVMDKPRRFSFIWPMDETIQPDDPGLKNKATRVEFTLKPSGRGTRLTVRESGFEKLPGQKRLQIFRDNEDGWEAQIRNIQGFLR